MRERIAVFSGGWGGDYLQEVLAGIIAVANENDADVFAFVNFSIVNIHEELNNSEYNLFCLPNLDDFDGVILLANSFNSTREIPYLVSEIERTGIPAVTVEYPLPGLPLVSTDNYSGMRDLVDHLISEHNVKSILCIGGPKEHPESNERIRAVREAMIEAGYPFDDHQVVHGNWSKDLIPEIMLKWTKENGGYPDAIVCANDIMAIAVCGFIKNAGGSIPRDVIVTGYDYIRLGRHKTPSITSVSHEWGPMGKLAMTRLLQVMNGEEVPRSSVMKTRFIPGGSCGCHGVRPAEEENHYGDFWALAQMDPTDVDSHFRHFYTCIKKVRSRDDISYGYGFLFENEHQIEGDTFRICMNPDFFDMSLGDEGLPELGYPDYFDVVCDIRNGKRLPGGRVSRREVLFECSDERDKPGHYFFMPLSSDHKTYGFAMLTGQLNVASDNQYYVWSRHMDQSLEQAHSTLLLSDLYNKLMVVSVTDALTGVYNRLGGQNRTYPMLLEHAASGGKCAVMLCDVDGMKIVNDRFGHASGDIALKIVTRVLRDALPRGFEISRFGGDEFFVGGRMPEKGLDLDELIIRINEMLRNELAKRDPVFPISISIGYTVIKPNDIVDIEKAIVIADNRMYEMKQKNHKMRQ